MKKQEPRISFSAYTNATDTELPFNVDEIIKSMTGNPNFPNPVVSIGDLSKSLADYRLYILPPGDRTSDTKDLREANRAIVLDQVLKLGKYAEMTAAGNLVSLRSSGFILVEREPVSNPPSEGKVKGFRVKGAMDKLEILCETEPNVKLYEAQIWVGDAAEPFKFSNSTATIIASGLPLGVLLTVQTRKVNAVGEGAWGATYKTRLPVAGEVFPVQVVQKNK